jgi:hypothetical protein
MSCIPFGSTDIQGYRLFTVVNGQHIDEILWNMWHRIPQPRQRFGCGRRIEVTRGLWRYVPHSAYDVTEQLLNVRHPLARIASLTPNV